MEGLEMSKSNWVTHKQLDTPLCDIFSDVEAPITARQFIEWSEFFLNLPSVDLTRLSYVELNRYIERLDDENTKMLERLRSEE